MANEFMYWNELRDQPINVAGQGRQIGGGEDFYYEPDTYSIKALRINAGCSGYRVLLASASAAIGPDGVTIANANMLIDEGNAGDLSQFPRGDRLRGFRVTKQGSDLGKVANLLLAISPPVTLRIAAIELECSRARIAAHAIVRFGADELSMLE